MSTGQVQEKEREIPQIMATIDNAVIRLEESKENIFKKTASVTKVAELQNEMEEKGSGASTDLGSQLMSFQKRIDIVSDELFKLVDQIEL